MKAVKGDELREFFSVLVPVAESQHGCGGSHPCKLFFLPILMKKTRRSFACYGKEFVLHCT